MQLRTTLGSAKPIVNLLPRPTRLAGLDILEVGDDGCVDQQGAESAHRVRALVQAGHTPGKFIIEP